MFFAADKFRFLKSTPTFHEVVGGSGRLVRRGFCGKCGSRISAHWPEDLRIQIVTVSSLDDHPVFNQRPKFGSHVHSHGILFIPAPRNSRVGRQVV